MLSTHNVEPMRVCYRKLALILHPDKETGDTDSFIRLKILYEAAQSQEELVRLRSTSAHLITIAKNETQQSQEVVRARDLTIRSQEGFYAALWFQFHAVQNRLLCGEEERKKLFEEVQYQKKLSKLREAETRKKCEENSAWQNKYSRLVLAQDEGLLNQKLQLQEHSQELNKESLTQQERARVWCEEQQEQARVLCEDHTKRDSALQARESCLVAREEGLLIQNTQLEERSQELKTKTLEQQELAREWRQELTRREDALHNLEKASPHPPKRRRICLASLKRHHEVAGVTRDMKKQKAILEEEIENLTMEHRLLKMSVSAAWTEKNSTEETEPVEMPRRTSAETSWEENRWEWQKKMESSEQLPEPSCGDAETDAVCTRSGGRNCSFANAKRSAPHGARDQTVTAPSCPLCRPLVEP